MNAKAAIFDMDGTLVDSLKVWGVVWSRFGERFLGDKGFAPREDDDKKVRTLTFKESMELIHINYGLGKNVNELLEYFWIILEDFYKNDVELKEGVREFLEYCKSNGVKMCIASATDSELIEIALKHCGIEHYFSKIFSCGSIGKSKDKPDVFLMAAEYLGEKTADTWVFEDSLVAIRTAKSIGMPTVGIYDRFNFGQDEIKMIANEYVDDGETLLKLI